MVGVLGLLVLNIGQTVFKKESGLLSGMVVAGWEQLRGKGLIDPAAKVVKKVRRSV